MWGQLKYTTELLATYWHTWPNFAVRDFGEWACISLRPKTQIAQHYIDKYKMNITGVTLSLEVPEIFELIELYDHDN